MMSVSLPPELPATLGALAELVTLLSDPKAAKDRAFAIQKAAEEFRNAAEALQIERATFAAAQAAHNEALSKATAEQTDKLAAERTAFDTACSNRKSDLDTRTDQIAKLQAKALADADAAATIRTDVERRLSLLKQAAG